MTAAATFGNVEAWLTLALFSLVRPSAALIAAPLFGGAQVPLQLRLAIALAIGIAGLRGVSPAGLPDPLSLAGVGAVAGEAAIGGMIGFAVQLGFAAALTAGEVVGGAMGLGFAALVDPLSGRPTQALGQWLTVIATLLFFIGDGHLLLMATIADSYAHWPIGGDLGLIDEAGRLAGLGGAVLSAGIAIAAPVLGAVLMVQLAMAMMARSSPQLNLFAVGFPAMLLAGLLLLALGFPAIRAAIDEALAAGQAEAQIMATRAR